MLTNYLTIAANTQFEQEIKKSRFICTLARIQTEADAQQIITATRTTHRKANHNCFAYVLGTHNEIKRESDNGEPSGTAGLPILNVLEQENIHDVLAIVTRYFGGIKLGAGGLIRAYGGTTSAAIQAIGLVEKIRQRELVLTVDYAVHDRLKYFLENHALTIKAEEFATQVTVHLPVNELEIDRLRTELTDQFNGHIEVQLGEVSFNEVPYQKDGTK